MRQSFSRGSKWASGGCVLLSMLLFCLPLLCKGWNDFKLNSDYSVSFPENWYRVEPGSTNFSVNSKETKEGVTPANIQIRVSELSPKEAALNWKDFVAMQLDKHVKTLEDNWVENPQIGPPDSLAVNGADMAFHLRTDVPEDFEPYILLTDYARKGLKLYLIRFYCPMDRFEKYLTDYYVIRGTFKLR